MTLALTAAMEAARVSTQKRPRFVVEFDGIPYSFGFGDNQTAYWFYPLKFGDGTKFGFYSAGDVPQSKLSASMNTTQTYLDVSDASLFPDQGAVGIGSFSTYEICLYAEKIGQRLNNLTRGYSGTAPKNHNSGVDVKALPVFGGGLYTETTVQNVGTLHWPSGISADVAPEQGRSSVSGMDITLQRSDEIDEILNDYELKGRVMRVKHGFGNVTPADWVTLWTGVVDSLKANSDGLTYSIGASDVQRFAKRQVFKPLQATLASAILEGTAMTGSGTITVGTGEADAFPSTGYIRIDKECFYYTGASGNQFTGVTRARMTTIAAAHSADAKVFEVFVLGYGDGYTYGLSNGHPIDIALAVLTSTGNGTNGAWDVLPERHGLGIDVDLIRVNDWTTIRDDITAIQMQFWNDAPVEGKAWIETEIMKVCGCYMITKGDGTLSIKLFEPPETGTDVPEITDDDIVGMPSVDANFSRHYNEIVWQFDYDPADRGYDTVQTEQNQASLDRYGERFSMVVESKGLRTKAADGVTSLSGATIATARSGVLFGRYAFPPLLVSFSAFWEFFHVEPGDLITFYTAHALDPKAGGRGVGIYVMEVVSRSINPGSGTVDFTCLYTPFEGARFADYAPVGTVDYASVPADQQDAVWGQFVFIGDGGEMSNNDEAYKYSA